MTARNDKPKQTPPDFQITFALEWCLTFLIEHMNPYTTPCKTRYKDSLTTKNTFGFPLTVVPSMILMN